jgi:molybdenum-dependent DNA-binding transcriptional regulator ModE
MSFWNRRRKEEDCEDLTEVANRLVVTIQEATETVREAVEVQKWASMQLTQVAEARMEDQYDPLG